MTYTVGTGATYRPFEFQAPNRELVGFDIDLVKAIAKEQGFKVEFINTLFGVIFESVRNGDRDMIISGITITPQRKEAVDFFLSLLCCSPTHSHPEESDSEIRG